MFTGIVQDIGVVEGVERSAGGVRLEIATPLASALRPGDSIAVDGACLTAAGPAGTSFAAEVMNQTLSLTTIGELEPGARVNLEPALRAGEPLGGHLVQGHVDGVGEVVSATEDGFARRLLVALPGGFGRYVVEHGSITLAGVSLTVAGLDDERGAVEVSLIPETLERTVLGAAAAGTRLNVELDIVARYTERLLGLGVRVPEVPPGVPPEVREGSS